jgi:type III secretory pathway component EscS
MITVATYASAVGIAVVLLQNHGRGLQSLTRHINVTVLSVVTLTSLTKFWLSLKLSTMGDVTLKGVPSFQWSQTTTHFAICLGNRMIGSTNGKRVTYATCNRLRVQ